MKHIIISALYLLILFCLSKFVFDPSYLYYEIPWLDIPMHIMGGFGVASLAGAILAYNGEKISYFKLFVAYIVVAVTWELYEYIVSLTNFLPWNGWFDTIKDIIDGFIGMSVAYIFVKK
ncbi:MAG: hypothetical protein WCT07_01580 [Candidatus Paceibacterota bacterium]|jgi:hypothetical protein